MIWILAFLLAGNLALGQVTGGLMFPGPGAAAAGPPGTPALWYSADCITYSAGVCSTPSSGSTISTWSDRSGNANDGTIAAGTCTYTASQINSQPAVVFSPCQINFGGVNTQTTVTIVAVMKFTSTSGNSNCMVGNAGNTFNGFVWQLARGGKEQYWENPTGPTGSGAAASDTNWHQAMLLTTAATVNTSQMRLGRANDGATFTTGNSTVNTTRIGDCGWFYMSPLNWSLAELLIYTTILNSTAITAVETYLNGKYGV